MYWIASGGSNGWDGTTGMTLQYGASGGTASANYLKPTGTMTGSVRRINIYDVVNGASKVFSDTGEVGATSSARLIPIGGDLYNAGSAYFKNDYNVSDADLTGSTWATNTKYVLKLTLSGATEDGTVGTPCPRLWNIFDATQGHGAIIKEVDDSAYNLNSLSITSDISVGREGQYFKAITRKGKVFVVKTGIEISEIGFSSVALGDEKASDPFDSAGPSTLYGHLHTLRKIQADSVPIYWDEPQKDGTFVRFWGIVSNLNETRGTGGPRAIMNYTFTLVVQKIALIQNTGLLMTGVFPLGGLKYERDYS